MDDIGYQPAQKGRFASLWHWVLVGLDRSVDALEEDWAIIRRETDIFLGSLLLLVGLLNFHSGKYCDGNTADYLSCTRPVTYYYYTWIEIIPIVLGVMFILLWFMKRNRN